MDRSSIQLGPVGIWTIQFEKFPAAKMQEAAAELEELGYGAIWFGEATGREALTQAGLLLAAAKKIVVATGIANIYARDPFAMAAGQKTLAEAYAGRFLLGLGVSHIPLVEKLRGHRYEKPLSTMRVYLDAMDQAPHQAVPPSAKPWRVLAALGPKMLELAAERADGAHPYNVSPEHTAQLAEYLAKAHTCARNRQWCWKLIRRRPVKSAGTSSRFILACLITPITFCVWVSTSRILKAAAVTG
jgi:probable F420-dependent oxidoreductase